MEFPQGADLANPTASVGLTAVNGTASTAMRSDAAPALSQAISPTWSGNHIFSNPVSLPAGSASTPGWLMNTNYGMFYASSHLSIGLGGTESFRFWNNTQSVPAIQFGNSIDDTFAGSRTICAVVTGGSSNNAVFFGEGNVNFTFERVSNDATSPSLILAHGRGTIASPAVPALNDALGVIDFRALTTLNPIGNTASSRIQGTLIETGTVAATAVGGRLLFSACPIGSGTLSEIMRLDTANGLSMFGANIVIDANRVLRRRVFTVGTLPTGVDGMDSFVSDALATTFATAVVGGGSNHVPVYYDSGASAWKIG